MFYQMTTAIANNPNFGGMTDAEVGRFLEENGFICYRKLPDGEWIGMLRLVFTMSVCCGITKLECFKYR